MARIQIDALVRGPIGSSQKVGEMRVVRMSPHGWAFGIGSRGQQRIMYEFEVIGSPRPMPARRDIPERFR